MFKNAQAKYKDGRSALKKLPAYTVKVRALKQKDLGNFGREFWDSLLSA